MPWCLCTAIEDRKPILIEHSLSRYSNRFRQEAHKERRHMCESWGMPGSDRMWEGDQPPSGGTSLGIIGCWPVRQSSVNLDPHPGTAVHAADNDRHVQGSFEFKQSRLGSRSDCREFLVRVVRSGRSCAGVTLHLAFSPCVVIGRIRRVTSMSLSSDSWPIHHFSARETPR